ncbi:MAG: hypothetical protein ACREL6_03595 [Gemmatimonadales bacterium]
MNTILLGVMILFALLALSCLALGWSAFRRRKAVGGTGAVLLALVFLALGLACGTIAVATQGYRAFTREETVATIVTRPTGPHSFEARFRFSDGLTRTFDIQGDQLYVDAHIVKWHPIVNVLGVHTGYELDRIGGRYHSIDDERSRPRSLYQLKEPKLVDAFELARKYTFLAPLVDAEYGSATFTEGRRSARFMLNISTSGLLVRTTEQ